MSAVEEARQWASDGHKGATTPVVHLVDRLIRQVDHQRKAAAVLGDIAKQAQHHVGDLITALGGWAGSEPSNYTNLDLRQMLDVIMPGYGDPSTAMVLERVRALQLKAGDWYELNEEANRLAKELGEQKQVASEMFDDLRVAVNNFKAQKLEAERLGAHIAAAVAVLDRVDGDPSYSPGWSYLSGELRPILSTKTAPLRMKDVELSLRTDMTP